MTSSDATPELPQEVFPALRAGLSLHRTADGGHILVPTRASIRTSSTPAKGKEFVAHDVLRTEGYLVDYLAILDGVSSRPVLASTFSHQYGPLFGSMLEAQAWAWVEGHPALVDLHEAPLLDPRRTPMTGGDDGFYPIHATFEIIETRNFTCEHCYYQSSPSKTGRVSLEQSRQIMDVLAARGVRCIELTGGECTIHPDFCEILAYATKRFDLVAVISSGYRIGTSEAIAEAVCAAPNVMVQISIDAIGERHDRFRKHPRAFDAAVRAVRVLQDAGIVTRIASSISEANIDQVEELYQLGKMLRVQKHSFASVAPLGRGCNISDSGAGSRAVHDAIEQQLAPHRDDPVLNNYAEVPGIAEYGESRNCGAGWRTVAVDYEGNVRACNYSRRSKQLGSVLADDYGAIFAQQASFFFHNAPSPGGKDCVGCAFYTHCRGCFVKAFMVSETEYPECPWRRHWFPGMSLSLDEGRHHRVSVTDRRKQLPAYTPQDSPHRVCGSCCSPVVTAGSHAHHNAVRSWSLRVVAAEPRQDRMHQPVADSAT
jgi:radical SAM protein with 4Fe4S-binding SPASM domain